MPSPFPEYDELLAQYEYAVYRSEIAAAVLYFVALLGGFALCIFVFTKLQSPGRGVLTWLRASCIIFTLFCAVEVCVSALSAPLDLRVAKSSGDQYVHASKSHILASRYMEFVGDWLNYIAQGLVFVTIVATCASAATASHTGKALKNCLVVAYVVATLAILVASALVALHVAQYYMYTHRAYFYRVNEILIASAYVTLVLICILAAAAVFAAAVAAWTATRSGHLGGTDKHSKLAVCGAVLLMLSTIFQLAWIVHFGWVAPTEFGGPAYIVALTAVLNAWPLLGALALVFLSVKSWNEGAAKQEMGGFA